MSNLALTSLTGRPYVFVDTETTGTNATHNQIIEIAIVRVEGGKVVDEYQTLIKPLRGVPDFITTVNGISNDDLVNAPPFEEVALTIKEKLHGAVFVAHNARFDYSFVKNEFKRLDIPFTAKTLCTVKLSRMLFPEHRHHNLDAIIERFGLSCENRHRAYDDTLMLVEFIRKAEQELTAEIVSQAVASCFKAATLPPAISKSVISALPKGPGVYIFYGPENEVLYVGKSVHIKTRVLSHFSGDHNSAKELAICSQVTHIEARETTGELSALFLESKLIKELAPVYNRMLRKLKKMLLAFEAVGKDGYKSISLEYKDSIDKEDMGSIVGIFRSNAQAKAFLSVLVKEHALCGKLLGSENARGACFGYQLETCKGACVGQEEANLYNLRFDAAFKKTKLKSWPYSGPITIKEENDEYEGTAYVIDAWSIQKQITYANDVVEESSFEDADFDFDTYKILARYLLSR